MTDDSSSVGSIHLPEEKVSGAHANSFIQNRIVSRYSNWDGVSWEKWTPPDVADMVRAIAQDYLEDHGAGHDWQEAGQQAQFVMAGIYNDVVNFRANGRPQGHDYDMRLSMVWPGREEAFEVVLMRPTEHMLSPVPLPNGSMGYRDLTSIIGQASVRAPAPFDCMRISNEGILSLLDQLVGFFGGKDRLSLIFAAAMLVRWKGCQVSQAVQGGGVYRQIKNPEFPQMPEADARILYARVGPHLGRHFSTQGTHCNVVALV